MALKVCQLCAVDFTVQHFLLPLIEGMTGAGWEVTTVCSDGKYVPGLRQRGCRMEIVPISRSFNVLAHAVSLWRLYRLFRRERFDVLHVHTPIAALIARIAGYLAGIPLIVYTAHGFYFHDEMPPWKRRQFVGLEKFAGRFTDLLFTQSKEDAEAAVAEKISPSSDVLAIGNGVDPTRFDPARVPDVGAVRRGLGIPPEAMVVGIIGRMVLEKGYGEFFEAACRLAERFPSVVFLQVGGRLESDHNAGIADLVAEAQRKLGDRLVLAGFRSDTPELLAAMDVFCLPSWREGMPRTIIEAMMMGKPVVATDIRGSREEVVNEQTGLLVPPRSPDLLSAALARLIENPKLAVTFGEAGRERALALYDETKVIAMQLDRIEIEAHRRGLC